MTYDNFKCAIENIVANLGHWTGTDPNYGFRIWGRFSATNGVPVFLPATVTAKVIRINTDAVVIDNGMGGELILIAEEIHGFAIIVADEPPQKPNEWGGISENEPPKVM